MLMYPDYQKICEERHGALPASQVPFQWTRKKTLVVLTVLAFAVPGYILFGEMALRSAGKAAAETVLMLLRCVGITIKS